MRAADRLASTGLPTPPQERLDDVPVEARSLPRSPISVADVRRAGWSLDELWLPAVVLDGAALNHNLDRFARWCRDRGVDLAPHGKTTMSPHLWSAQLERGAWGITAATVAQARVMRAYGVPRVLIANEVTDPPQIVWLGEALADPDFDVMCLVDSLDEVRLLEQHLGRVTRPLPVLVELGVPGRRTGVRGVEAALALAREVTASPVLLLAGIEGYEGVLPQRRDDEAEDAARAWLQGLGDLVVAADREGLFGDVAEVVVTAGGSGHVDLVADAFASLPELSRQVRRVLRSGCYLTHDDLMYERSSPLRSGAVADPLVPALTCYARVLSVPDEGRALLGVGKRDVSSDIDLPVVRAVHRDGERMQIERGAMRVVELNDQHAFCDLGRSDLVRVGDVVELGISHPCTTFDKWPLIPVVDEHRRVVDAVRTLF